MFIRTLNVYGGTHNKSPFFCLATVTSPFFSTVTHSVKSYSVAITTSHHILISTSSSVCTIHLVVKTMTSPPLRGILLGSSLSSPPIDNHLTTKIIDPISWHHFTVNEHHPTYTPEDACAWVLHWARTRLAKPSTNPSRDLASSPSIDGRLVSVAGVLIELRQPTMMMTLRQG